MQFNSYDKTKVGSLRYGAETEIDFIYIFFLVEAGVALSLFLGFQ